VRKLYDAYESMSERQRACRDPENTIVVLGRAHGGREVPVHGEVMRVPIDEAKRLLLKAESANNGFEMFVETVKVHEEVQRMAYTLRLCSRNNDSAARGCELVL
jgi:hypothetical protein